MFEDILKTFLFSISPFGEARVGIPLGIASGLNPWLALLIGVVGNLLVFPMVTSFIKNFDHQLWKYKSYRKQSVKLIRKAKSRVGEKITKYGFWGLMVFVMIPLPLTGAYMGSIAAHVLGIETKSAFKAISLGVIISCILMMVVGDLGVKGVKLV